MKTGGNCELTEPGKPWFEHGVTIASPLNLPATMPEHASELYARNVDALLEQCYRRRDVPDFATRSSPRRCVTSTVTS